MAWSEKWVIPFTTKPFVFNLECLADFQLGSRSCCEWKIEQHVKDILYNAKYTESGILFAGDIEDEDRPSTRMIRAKIAAERSEVVERDSMKHISWLEQKVIPLLLKLHKGTKYGIMGGVAGHHFTQLTPDMNSVEYIFRRLKELTGKPCVYLGQMVSFVTFTFLDKNSGKICKRVGLLQHGEGGGQTKASTLTRLERTVQGFHADFYIRGHDCQLVGTKTDQLFAREQKSREEGKIGSRTKVMLNLGSATMGYEYRRDSPSYIESAMMRPATLGWGTIQFRIRCSSTFEDKDNNLTSDLKLIF